MPNIPRYLITTADERTWKFDCPVIFLGEWCRLYDRKHIWQGMDAIVAAPYGVSKVQKDADHAEARVLEEKLFAILCEALNQYHGKQHDQRFWRIVLGHWLRRFVNVILNRVRTLEQCLRVHQLSGTTAFSDERYALAPMDSYTAIWAFNDDRWNNTLYFRILNLLGEVSCPVEVVAGDASEGFCWLSRTGTYPLQRRILKWGYHQVHKLSGYLARENDAFIINCYLPKKVEVKLQLALGQVPQLWVSPRLILTKKPDRALRRNLSDQFDGRTNDTLFGIMRSLVFELLPVCYLESFDELTEKVQQLHWPKRPQFIFTSNNFDTDEAFKLWAATKIEFGSQYIIGQHGNNYGTHRFLDNHSIEEKTADKFLTWGWTDGLPQHTPAFVFKTVGHKAESYDPNGGLLLIELPVGQMIHTWDVTAEFKAYFEDQQSFVIKLLKPIKQHLTVRLHYAYTYFRCGEEGWWREFDAAIKLETGSTSLSKLVAQSRLIIHSYDSTGMLETLSQNIPTLVFWQNDFDHLRDSAKPYYQLLVDAGIVHLSPESAAAKVNEVWDDVEGWWSQSAVQVARKQFCDRYARVSQHPISDITRLLV